MKQLLTLKNFYFFSGKLIPYLSFTVLALLGMGMFSALFIAPIDYQQGYAVKIMYIHVPCAILSLSIYTIIGIASALYLIFKIKIADIIAKISAPFGASITALTLFSGMLWGKPMWGTWWVWDARLTSELILLFLYFGYIGLRSAFRDISKAATLSAILALVGLIDIPIIHFSVEWWHTLHQGASITKLSKPSITSTMLYPLIIMLIACYLFYILIVLIGARREILWRERNTIWVKQCLST
jgi:heme exporter protein C